MKELNYIQKEVFNVLKTLGYDVQYEYRSGNSDYSHMDFFFPANSETMQQNHKDAILMLAKGYLKEFYYAPGVQHIYISDFCITGLLPSSTRYSCLLYEIANIEDDKSYAPGSEIFVNMGTHFKRLVNWVDKSAKN